MGQVLKSGKKVVIIFVLAAVLASCGGGNDNINDSNSKASLAIEQTADVDTASDSNVINKERLPEELIDEFMNVEIDKRIIDYNNEVDEDLKQNPGMKDYRNFSVESYTESVISYGTTIKDLSEKLNNNVLKNDNKGSEEWSNTIYNLYITFDSRSIDMLAVTIPPEIFNQVHENMKLSAREYLKFSKLLLHYSDDPKDIYVKMMAEYARKGIDNFNAGMKEYSKIKENDIKSLNIKAEDKNLGIKIKDFIKDYNAISKASGSNLPILELKWDGIEKSATASLNQNIGYFITVNPETEFINAIIQVGTGDGTADSGQSIIESSLLFLSTIDKSLKIENSKNVILRLLENKDKVDYSITENGVSYSISQSKTAGIWISAVPK